MSRTLGDKVTMGRVCACVFVSRERESMSMCIFSCENMFLCKALKLLQSQMKSRKELGHNWTYKIQIWVANYYNSWNVKHENMWVKKKWNKVFVCVLVKKKMKSRRAPCKASSDSGKIVDPNLRILIEVKENSFEFIFV